MRRNQQKQRKKGQNRSLRQNLRQLLNEQHGDAMVVVLCLLFFFMMLTLVVLLASASLQNAQRRSENQTVVRVMAISMMDLLTAEMEDTDSGMCQDIITMLENDGGLAHCWDQELQAEEWEYVLQTEEKTDGFTLELLIHWGDEEASCREEILECLEEENPEKKDRRQIFDGASLYFTVRCRKTQESYHIKREFAISVLEMEEDYVWQFEPVSQTVGQSE